MANIDLQRASNDKKDEFYTQLPDIEEELKYYTQSLKGKTVLCNCDDPYESNFFYYFATRFNDLGLKKLICTCYAGSSVSESQLSLFDIPYLSSEPSSRNKRPYKIEITEVSDLNDDGAIDIVDVEQLIKNKKNTLTVLEGNGDFRSGECIELLKTADVVVTNPPFSHFREYVAQLIEYGKKFIIIGNINCVTYKEIFPLIENNEVWIGRSIRGSGRVFMVPDDYPFVTGSTYSVDEKGRKYIRVRGVRWFTNLDYKERHEELILYKQYSQCDYPRFGNYDAINVDKVEEIPDDYYEVMGVPITFLDKHCPDQFEIIGLSKTPVGSHLRTKIYPKQIQYNKDGSTQQVTKLNDGAALEVPGPVEGKIYYKVDEKYYVATYPRVLIRRKRK